MIWEKFELIPMIKLNDKATWIDEPKIAVSIDQFRYFGYLSEPFFEGKTVVLLSICPDDFFLAETFNQIVKRMKDLYLGHITLEFSSNDGPIYEDWDRDIIKDEIEFLDQENQDLFKIIKPDYGLLKGVTKDDYQKSLGKMSGKVKNVLIYLSGYIRANPRYFGINVFMKQYFNFEIKEDIYFYGFPMKQLESLKGLPYHFKGIITSNHILRGIYKSNPHYKRRTRFLKEWNKMKNMVSEL